MADFDRAFGIVVGIEAGYVNDPNDPGGETKYGITKRWYPNLDIKNLTQEQAEGIYHTQYWVPAQCESLPWPLSCYVFDAAINQGAGTAVMLLQKALRVPQDGIWGKASVAALAAADMADLAPRFMALRALRYTGTRNFDKEGEGWLWRLFTVTSEAA